MLAGAMMVDRSGLRAHRTRFSAVPIPILRMRRATDHCHQNSTRPSRCFHARRAFQILRFHPVRHAITSNSIPPTLPPRCDNMESCIFFCITLGLCTCINDVPINCMYACMILDACLNIEPNHHDPINTPICLGFCSGQVCPRDVTRKTFPGGVID